MESPRTSGRETATAAKEFIVGARGVTLYEVVQTMRTVSRDIWWMKWLLLVILGALIAGIISRAIFSEKEKEREV